MVPPDRQRRAFTLIELVVVIGIIVLLSLLAVPAFTNLRGSGDLTQAAEMISGTLAQARNYAIANNTYAWAGFYEEAADAATATNDTPPYPGKGRLILAIVASKDGTTSCEDPASTSGSRIPLLASKITQVGKLVKIEGVHLADIGAPAPGAAPLTDANSIDARADFPYTNNAPALDYQNRISSDDSHTPENQTIYPFVAQGYTFHKTLRFTPRGEAQINGTYNLRRVVEIGLRPTHGRIVDVTNPNVIAIQFSAVGGNFKIYRR
jgi:prepilin-type N-terminal cleavage/methylation domain-containing protein